MDHGALRASSPGPNTDSLRVAIDDDVLIPLARTVAEQSHELYVQMLRRALPGAWFAPFPLPHEWPDGVRRAVLVAPVKGAARIKVKVSEYRDQEHARFGVTKMGDILRATVVCRDGSGLRSTWEGLQREFDVREGNGRLKNNLTKSSRPPDMLMNAIFHTGKGMSMPVEIQIHHKDILQLKEEEHHLFYEVSAGADEQKQQQQRQPRCLHRVCVPRGARDAAHWPAERFRVSHLGSLLLAPCSLLCALAPHVQIFRVKPAKGGSIQDLRDAAIAKGLFPVTPTSTAPQPAPLPAPASTLAASEREGSLQLQQELAAKDAKIAEQDEELARLREMLDAALGGGK